MDSLRAWARQPTTVAGISAALGTLVALALGQMQWAQAIPLLAGAAASMLLPDNSGARTEAVDLATDLVSDFVNNKGTGS